MRFLHGPFGERFEIVHVSELRAVAPQAPDTGEERAEPTLPDDPVLIEGWLYRLLDEPWNEHVLRWILDEGWGHGPLDLHALVRALANRLAYGELRLRALDRDWGIGGLGGEGETQGDDDAPASNEDQVRPCDFETVVLQCSHADKRADFRFWRDGAGVDHHNLKPPADGGPPNKIIEVIADHVDSGADEITVQLEGGPGYTCARKHPRIIISSQTDEELVFEGQTTAKFKAKSKPLLGMSVASRSPFSVISYFFFRDAEVQAYTIDVQACGVRPGGALGFGRSQHRLKAYPSDLFELSLSIPSLKKSKLERGVTAYRDRLVFEGSSEATRGLAGEKEAERRQLSVSGSGVGAKDEYSVATRDGKLTETTTTDYGWGLRAPTSTTTFDESKEGVDRLVKELGASLTLKRNGKDLEEAAALGKMVKTLFEIEKEVKSIKDFIQKFQPAVGFKFALEIEVFKGDLKLEWGYKEWKDHTVYRWWKLSVEMTLLKLELELKFGVDFRIWRFVAEFVVYGKISLDAKLSGSKESTPDDSSPWEASVASEPKSELGIRLALGPDALSLGGKVEAGYSFAATCKVTTREPFRVDWSMDRKETVAKVEGKIKWVGSFSRKVTLIDEKKNIKKGYFPS